MSDRAKPEDIEAVVEIFQKSAWKEMHLRYKDIEIFLSKEAGAKLKRQIQTANPASKKQTPKVPTPEDESAKGSSAPDHWLPIKAPNLGTFYRAPRPGEPPFVELGQSVKPDSEICLIEVMKLFTALKAGVSGLVQRICAEDGELIENGQTLFYVEPDEQ